MRVRYSPRAFADRDAIFAYIEKRSAQGARAVKHAIVGAIRLLASHPRMAPLTDEPRVHELNVPRRPYKVYYRIERDEVWIVHIRDARRRPWRDRN
jgi:plasmid stabilization system protein ParE